MPDATHRLSNVVPYAISLVKRGANGQSFFLRKTDGAVLEGEQFQVDQGGVAVIPPYGDVEPLLPLPHAGDMIAKADWSAVYCVVASPSAVENGGMLSPEVWDQWADADEIRKAAHAFMRNGALVNKMHEDLAPYGQIVENAIALVDVEIEDTTIEKGSWYVAIEPTDEGIAAIESGEFTGISIEGTGSRAEISKADPKAQGTKGHDRAGASSAQTCSKCRGKVAKGAKVCQNCGHKLSGYTGTDVKKGARALDDDELAIAARHALQLDQADVDAAIEKARAPLKNKPGKSNWLEATGGLPRPIRELAEEIKGDGKSDSEAIQRAIGIARKYAAGVTPQGKKISAAKQQKWARAVARYEAQRVESKAKTAAKNAVKKETSVSKFLKAVGAALGIDPAEYDVVEPETIDEEMAKASVATFAQRIAAREVEDDLPMATDALRGAIYDAIYPYAYGYSDPPAPAEARAALDESLGQFHEYLLGVFDRVVSNDIAKSRDALLLDLATLGSEGTDGADHEEDDDMGEPASKIEKLETDVAAIGTKVDGLVTSLEPLLKRVQEETAPTVEDLTKSVDELKGSIETITKGIERLGAGGSNQTDTEPVAKSDDPLVGLLA